MIQTNEVNALFNAISTIIRLAVLVLPATGVILIVIFHDKIEEFLKRKKGMTDYYNQMVIQTIQQMLPGARIYPERHINSLELYDRGVIPHHDLVGGTYLVEYEKEGYTYSFSNLALSAEHGVNKNNKLEISVFSGQAFTMRFKSSIPGHVRIMSTYNAAITGQEKLAGYKRKEDNEYKVELESRQFNECFDVYATDNESAFYVLTPLVMEQLITMRQRCGNFGICVDGDRVYAAFNNSRELFKKPVQIYNSIPVNTESIRNELMWVLMVIQMIENIINGQVRR